MTGFCPSCGGRALSGARFCTHCGNDLGTEVPPAAAFPSVSREATGGKPTGGKPTGGKAPSPAGGGRRTLLGAALVVIVVLIGAVTILALSLGRDDPSSDRARGATTNDGARATSDTAPTARPAPQAGPLSDEEQAQRVVEEYLVAVTGGDGEAACSKVTDATKKNIERGGRPCAETISSLSSGPGESVLEAFEDADVENVKLNGDRGTADIRVNGLTQKTNLRKEDGEWRLDTTTGVGG